MLSLIKSLLIKATPLLEEGVKFLLLVFLLVVIWKSLLPLLDKQAKVEESLRQTAEPENKTEVLKKWDDCENGRIDCG